MHHQNNQQNPCLSTFKPTYCENLRLTHRDLIDLFEDGTHIENNFLDLASFSRSHKRQPWLFLLSAAKEIGAPNSFVSEFFITIYFQAPASSFKTYLYLGEKKKKKKFYLLAIIRLVHLASL